MNQKLAGTVLLLVLASTLPAQQPQPIRPNPQAPTLNAATPLAVTRGTRSELILTGTNLAGPTTVWTSFPCPVSIPTDANNGKDNARLRVVLDVPRDAPVGVHWLRLATTRGMSNFRLFCIDDLPLTTKKTGISKPATAQALTVPGSIVGRVDNETADYFKLSVKAGQRLSFEVVGRRLGGPIDPQLTILEAATGKEVAGGFANDSPGCQTDARLTLRFDKAGDYLIEVRDTLWRGGPDYHYLLRVGDFPCATTAVPMAVRRGSKTSVSFAGPALDGIAPIEVNAPNDPLLSFVTVAPRGPSGLSGWPVTLALVDEEQAVEKEPNDEPARANRVAVPGGVTGRLERARDRDHFVFAVKKGQRYVIEPRTLELGSPAEVSLTLKDARGTQVAVSNPAAPTARLDFTAAADGDLTLTVEHLHEWGGPNEMYYLSMVPYEPGFDLSVGLDRFDAAPGGTVSIPILMTRRERSEAIEVSVAGHPGLSGKVVIPATVPARPNVPAATLTVTLKADLPPGPIAFALVAKSQTGKGPGRLVNFRTIVDQALGTLPVPPANLETQFALAVKPRLEPSFELKVEPAMAAISPGGTTTLKVTVVRKTEPGAIDLSVAGLPAGVTAGKASIPAGQTAATLTLTAAPTAVVNARGTLIVTGSSAAKQTASAPAVPLTVVKK